MTNAAEAPYGKRLARVGTRLESLEHRVSQIEDEIQCIRAEIRKLEAKVDKYFLWTLGIIIAMWVSLVTLGVAGMITLLGRL